MRAGLAATLVAVLLGFSVHGLAQAAIRMATTIPPQQLTTALHTLVEARGFQIVYASELLDGRRSPGASGELTLDEALGQILSGTGLTYRYLDDMTVAIAPLPSSATRATSENSYSPPLGMNVNRLVELGQPSHLAALAEQDTGGEEAARPQSTPTPPAAADAAPIAQVVVTGSLLPRSDVNSASPVSVISAQQIQENGSLNLIDVLKEDPSVGVNSRGTTLTINGAGASYVNLRNLGNRRTLALVDGKRLPLFSDAIGNAGQDTSVIPSMMLERVEVLKDGASTIYGADAVAGVVNFILRDHYDGFLVDAHYGLSERGDGQSYRIGMLAGHSFDRGSVMVSASYDNQNPIRMNARDFTHPAIQTLAPLSGSTYGTPDTPGGEVLGPGPVTAAPIACYKFSPGAIPNPFNPACPHYDTSVESSLISGSSVRSLGLIAHYDVFDNVTASVKAFQTRRDSYTGFTGVASAQVDTSALTGVFPSGFSIPASNSNNPYGVDVRIRWRPSAYGMQPTDATSNLTHISTGLAGKIGGDRFEWEVSHSYSLTDGVTDTPNLINSVSLYNLLNPSICSADPVCKTVGYVPNIANLLSGTTRLTAAQQAYLFATDTSNIRFSTQQTIATISGKILTLPAGPVRLALGVEHRQENGQNTPDPLTQSGVLIGKFVFPTNGSFSTKEGFGELEVPLLADLPLAKKLTLDMQARYSNFSDFGGASTYKFGLNYTLTDSVRFRGAYGTSIRAPDVLELYGGGTGVGNTLTDPCNAGGLRAVNAQVSANCALLGVPATFTQTTGGALPVRTGGNPALQPERGRSYTFGLVLQPTFLPDFSATVDYYSIKITNAIGTGNTQLNLNACYEDPNLIQRASNPLDICYTFANRLPGGSLDRILNRQVNSSGTSTSGVDMGFDYHFEHLGPVPGALSTSLKLSWLNNFFQQNVNLAGTFVGGVDGSSAFPKWRGNLTTTYSVARFDVQWILDYIDHIQDQNYGTSIPVNNFMGYSGVPNYFLNGLLLRWRPTDATRVSFGVDNLFDKQPPFALVTTRNSLATLHDQIGRYFYLSVQQEF